MRHIFLSILIGLFVITGVAGQSEQEAVRILDSFSAKAKAAPSVSMKFDVVIVNQPEKTTDTLSGSLMFSGNRYRLELPDNTIFFNGETSWSYLPAEKEVTITKPDKNEDDSFMSDPSAIFSMYKNGYKNRLVEERSNSYIIDLYPENVKDEIIRIRLVISRQLEPVSVEYKRRDGITSTLYVRNYDLTQKPSPDSFTFQKEKYKGVEVIDMR
jgi:outer membrane lipoprotein carrier protein